MIHPTTDQPIDFAEAQKIYVQGVTKHDLRDYRGAVEDFEACLAVNPFHIDAMLGKAGARFMMYDFQNALADYDQAIDAIVKLLDDYEKQGQIRKILGEEGAGIMAQQEMLKFKPKLIDALYKRGSVKRFVGDSEGSCSDLEAAAEEGHVKAIADYRVYCNPLLPWERGEDSPEDEESESTGTATESEESSENEEVDGGGDDIEAETE